MLFNTAEPTGLARLLDGSGAPAANGFGHEQAQLASPPPEALRNSRNAKAARTSFFSEEVGQPVLNIPSLNLGELSVGPIHASKFELWTQCRLSNAAGAAGCWSALVVMWAVTRRRAGGGSGSGAGVPTVP